MKEHGQETQAVAWTVLLTISGRAVHERQPGEWCRSWCKLLFNTVANVLEVTTLFGQRANLGRNRVSSAFASSGRSEDMSADSVPPDTV
jgi:hypothetical protein